LALPEKGAALGCTSENRRTDIERPPENQFALLLGQRFLYHWTHMSASQAPAPPIPPQPQPKPVYVSFAAKVNEQTTTALMNSIAGFMQQGAQELTLLLSSPGGSVMHGMTLYNYLSGLPVALTTYNIGNVDSIGAIVFLAGARRYACPHSTFMLHPVAFGLQAAQSYEQPDLSAIVQSLEADQSRIAAIYAERSGLQKDNAMALFGQQKTYSASEAQTIGFVHEVKALSIRAGAHIFHLNVF
jgi:ATP-dependent Clp protease, protease subunit